ncbi:MAG: hypothetical protein QOK48_464 [Blastocatellia bacterium]|jgi:type II secretory pathway pseudopilin PulG|nr:hypothetical protein [Blastocatellia bacterium]
MTSKTQKIIIGVAVPVVVVFAFLGLILGAAVYVWKAAQKTGNEAATIQNIKTIAAVEIEYYNAHNRNFGTFEQLIREQMLTAKFSGNPPDADGYVFSLKVTPTTPGRPGSYILNADFKNEDTGSRHFYLDSTSATIHVNADLPATVNDPVL